MNTSTQYLHTNGYGSPLLVKVSEQNLVNKLNKILLELTCEGVESLNLFLRKQLTSPIYQHKDTISPTFCNMCCKQSVNHIKTPTH